MQRGALVGVTEVTVPLPRCAQVPDLVCRSHSNTRKIRKGGEKHHKNCAHNKNIPAVEAGTSLEGNSKSQDGIFSSWKMHSWQLQSEKGNCLITTPSQELVQVRGLPALGSYWITDRQGRPMQLPLAFHAVTLHTKWISYIMPAGHKTRTSHAYWFLSDSSHRKSKLY